MIHHVVADGVEREEEVNLMKLGVAILIWNNFKKNKKIIKRRKNKVWNDVNYFIIHIHIHYTTETIKC